MYATEDHCLWKSLVPLTYEAKLYYGAFIDKLDKMSGAFTRLINDNSISYGIIFVSVYYANVRV